MWSLSPVAGEDWCVGEAEEGMSSLSPSPFCSNQALKGLCDAHAHLGGQSTLLCPLVQTQNSPETVSWTHLEMMFS